MGIKLSGHVSPNSPQSPWSKFVKFRGIRNHFLHNVIILNFSMQLCSHAAKLHAKFKNDPTIVDRFRFNAWRFDLMVYFIPVTPPPVLLLTWRSPAGRPCGPHAYIACCWQYQFQHLFENHYHPGNYWHQCQHGVIAWHVGEAEISSNRKIIFWSPKMIFEFDHWNGNIQCVYKKGFYILE